MRLSSYFIEEFTTNSINYLASRFFLKNLAKPYNPIAFKATPTAVKAALSDPDSSVLGNVVVAPAAALVVTVAVVF